TIAYRRRLIDAPSYTLNHEEVEKALQEGIRFAEGLSPLAIEVDAVGHAAAIRLARADGSEATLPSRAVLVAAGTRPNTVLAREDPDHVELDGQYFRAVDEDGNPATPERVAKPGAVDVLQQSRPDGPTLAMEGLALTGAWTDPVAGLVGTIVLEMGGSSDLCVLLRPGEPVILMGPTGHATETPPGETVLLAGGGLGNAVLFSIGRALRAAGSRVLYFAGYKKLQDRYKVADIEAAADVVVWACDEAPGFSAGRPQDR